MARYSNQERNSYFCCSFPEDWNTEEEWDNDFDRDDCCCNRMPMRKHNDYNRNNNCRNWNDQDDDRRNNQRGCHNRRNRCCFCFRGFRC